MLNPFQTHLLQLMNQAGAKLCDFYRQAPASFSKSDGSPVTEADQAIDAFFQTHLKQLTPDIPIVSEEKTPFPQRASPNAPFWLLDPLDGTRSFVAQTGQFVISLALIKAQKPVWGILHVPLDQKTYMAFEGQAFYAVQEKVHVLSPGTVPNAWTAALGSDVKQVPQAFHHLPIHHIQKVQSALKCCLLAEGKAQFSWRFAPCYEWDIAAGHALLEAVGGGVLTLNRAPLHYGLTSHYHLNGGLVLYGAQEVQHLDNRFFNPKTG